MDFSKVDSYIVRQQPNLLLYIVINFKHLA